MGAYLTAPVTEKISHDGKYGQLSYGSSSMQGWRISQEDAHNCVPDFDDNSLFAVYDGHGGAEVAKYTALHLPDFIKETPQYKEGNYSQALEDAFLAFDELLKKEETVNELKVLAGLDDDNEEEPEEGEEETALLHQEACMPIEEILSKYYGTESTNQKVLENLKNKDYVQSPALRAKTVNKTNEESCDIKSKLVKMLANGSTDESASKTPSSENDANTEPTNCVEKDASKEITVTSDDSCTVKKDSLQPSNLEGTTDVVLNGKVSEKGTGSSSSSSIDEQGSSSASGSQTEQPGSSGQATSSSTTTAKKFTICDENDSDSDDTDEEEYQEDSEEEEDSEDEELDENEDETKGASFPKFITTEKEEPGMDSGCTAVVALLSGWNLFVANAGDSRCVLCRDNKAYEMSFDHKPEDEIETNRIKKAGGQITAEGRVNGGLNLSRALGDHSYKANKNLPLKDQMISPLPDVKSCVLDSKDTFMVIACDGIWNSMTSREVVDFINLKLMVLEEEKKEDDEKKLSKICEALFKHCLADSTMGDGTGCDNMTCIIVKFNFPECTTGNSTAVKRTSCDEDKLSEHDNKKTKTDSNT